jgi:hypothetical protein
VTFFRERANAVILKYGSRDGRSITAVEDAGIALRPFVPEAATAFIDQAIRLRQPEGAKSIDYWKDLQRGCSIGLQTCDQALDIRAGQHDSSPLELAGRTYALAQPALLYSPKEIS